MTRVLFICTGNVYRSALAERLLAVRLPPGSAVWPESAGTDARSWPGMEPSTKAVLEELGGDASGFASRRLTAELVTGSALVLGLAREHREAAVRLAPAALRRCYTLKEFVRLAAAGEVRVPDGEGPGSAGRLREVVAAVAALRGAVAPVPPAADDITDPWGLPQDKLYGCAVEIDGAVSRLARLLGADGGCSEPGWGAW